ncbi:uncharacterized protein I303_105256 [Kwoniella dejecticola CBS 10117]|uniref:DUF6534 domain-containing protein n=1 Tax=Kwoniella dejecticola CBS 10117 TaxID=1296121 RepID=A0A1A6A307_9TREE|nr:uncharacterized protein I303_05296 [Kwoniella dejecticola CBS 10117]OBR84438.1 hypothetical protein I303_05296 [Kwoniella dejecticola CBS 10117]
MAEAIPIGLTPEQVEELSFGVFGANKGFNLGPFLLGCLWDAVLFGVLTQQYTDWWIFSKPTERRPITWLTHWIIFASTAWTGTVIYYTLRNFVYYFGQYKVFAFIDLALIWPILGAAMSAPVQLFYAHRSYRLNGDNIFLLILFVCMVLTEIALTIVIAVKGSVVETIFGAAAVQSLVRAWQVVTMSTDVLMTVTLAWGLWKSRTGWSHTDALVKKLLLITIETQMAPTIVMLAFVISWTINSTSTLGLFFDLCIPKAYTVGYLATLNSRYALRRDNSLGSGQKQSSEPKLNTYPLGSSRLQQATVQIDTETYTESYQMQPTRSGVNREPQLYEVKEHEDEDSVENLDYAANLSRKNLNDPSTSA